LDYGLGDGRVFGKKAAPGVPDILRSLTSNRRAVILGTLMVTMTTVSFYMITAYTPTFGNSVLHLASSDSLMVTLCVGASNLFWLPIMGAFSDRVGRRPLLVAFTVLMLLTAYPAMLWLDCLWWSCGSPSCSAATTEPW
jgi:MFS transporter, MHS family, citrate/tricarballylate:H+ symporter